MAAANGADTLPVIWLLGPAFGTWIVVASFLASIQVLPTTDWVSAFAALWHVSLAFAIIVLCALVIALKRLFQFGDWRPRNIAIVAAAPLVTAVGILMMVAMMAPLSGM